MINRRLCHEHKAIKRTMLEQGIPAEIMAQFIFSETEDETPEEKAAFAAQMDRLLTRKQILSRHAGTGL